MVRFFWQFFILFFWLDTAAQLSQGGVPLEVPFLKNRGIPQIIMPSVNNHLLRQESEELQQQDERLKPFRFAYTFNLIISPDNNGIWINNVQGFDVWKVKIISPGAYSLNLIFDDFILPDGARLFLFNEQYGHSLGAFTSLNNKKSGRFAISPVAGDELTVQYEIPAGTDRNNHFVITAVNHDFVDILKLSERRPLGITAGSCNVDVNCGLRGTMYDLRDAVCRIIVNGREICSGVLVNNTGEHERPFILSAAHCYDKPEYAEVSVFTFNYESPYCAPLDGDPRNSITGAVMKAFDDSLDFSLVELSFLPPPEFMPYFAGWDRSSVLPDSTVSIHHPQGDIKKKSVDRNPPVISNFISGYTPQGFLRVLKWEEGVTENGSSGGPLFNSAGSVIGTLTGGSATCHNPVNDYFSRFSRAWEYKSDSSGQLKYWLDPQNLNVLRLQGKRIYTDNNVCMNFTNLEDFDKHASIILTDGSVNAGYWGGTNSLGITEFTERFSIPGNEILNGVSIGVGILSQINPTGNSNISVKVYNGNDKPEVLIHTETVQLKKLIANAMNYIGFSRGVLPADTFFVGFELSNFQPEEKFAVYQSLRTSEKENYFWFKKNGWWYDYKKENGGLNSISNVFELSVCNVEGFVTDTPLVKKPTEALIYPNPTSSVFTLETGLDFMPDNVKVYNLLGHEVKSKMVDYNGRKIKIDLSGNIPGVYFVKYETIQGIMSKKVTYMPR
jgi:lysyl endopeptidase